MVGRDGTPPTMRLVGRKQDTFTWLSMSDTLTEVLAKILLGKLAICYF